MRMMTMQLGDGDNHYHHHRDAMMGNKR